MRVAASKLHRAKAGKWNGKSPLGYDRKKHPEGGYVLVPNREAPLIRELFTLYAGGKVSLYGLTDFLNEKRHKVLTRAAVWNLLKNPAYIGMVRHGKWSHSNFRPKPEVTVTKGLHHAVAGGKTKRRRSDMPREEIDTTPGKPGGSRYIRRDKDGQFTDDQVSAGRSVAADKRVDAKHDAKKGDKDKGD